MWSLYLTKSITSSERWKDRRYKIFKIAKVSNETLPYSVFCLLYISSIYSSKQLHLEWHRLKGLEGTYTNLKGSLHFSVIKLPGKNHPTFFIRLTFPPPSPLHTNLNVRFSKQCRVGRLRLNFGDFCVNDLIGVPHDIVWRTAPRPLYIQKFWNQVGWNVKVGWNPNKSDRRQSFNEISIMELKIWWLA